MTITTGMWQPWMDLAECATTDPELFFPEAGAGGLPEAVAICNTCDAKTDCGEYADVMGIEHGVWGGRSAAERRRDRRKT